ncbi:MAG: ABC transporter substrate-binding protein [Proteobacteria bacterium]|nr:ABC transporter substrate-binding protein [Pseudomonadota bacterium]
MVLAAAFAGAVPVPAEAETLVKVGWCARTVSAAAAPFAIATKLGWFAKDGLKIELAPLPGSTDCVKLVATGDLPYSLPSVEPLAIIRPQGVKAKVFYTAYQGNIYGIAVPEESPVKSFADLKGKNIGLISMASGGLIIARALAATNGMDPDKDVNLVVAGEGAQTAALLRSKQVDALSQFDTQYAMVENAGVKLRMLDTKDIDRYPSNGFIALEATLQKRRPEAVALAQGYARGTVFAMANPRLERGGVTRWGESSVENYAAYAEFMLKWGVIKEKVAATDLVTNDLVGDINKFDAAAIAAEAKAYR